MWDFWEGGTEAEKTGHVAAQSKSRWSALYITLCSH